MERPKSALHLPLRPGGFLNQMVGTFSAKKSIHCPDRSACLCKPFPLHRGTPFLIRSMFSLCAPLFWPAISCGERYARCALLLLTELRLCRCFHRVRL